MICICIWCKGEEAFWIGLFVQIRWWTTQKWYLRMRWRFAFCFVYRAVAFTLLHLQEPILVYPEVKGRLVTARISRSIQSTAIIAQILEISSCNSYRVAYCTVTLETSVSNSNRFFYSCLVHVYPTHDSMKCSTTGTLNLVPPSIFVHGLFRPQSRPVPHPLIRDASPIHHVTPPSFLAGSLTHVSEVLGCGKLTNQCQNPLKVPIYASTT